MFAVELMRWECIVTVPFTVAAVHPDGQGSVVPLHSLEGEDIALDTVSAFIF